MDYEKEIRNLNKDATRLLEKYEEKIKEIERLNNIIDNAKEYIELLEDAFVKGEPLDIVLLDTERQILEGDEIPDITRKYLKEKIKGSDKE